LTVLGTEARQASTDTVSAFLCCTPKHTRGECASWDRLLRAFNDLKIFSR